MMTRTSGEFAIAHASQFPAQSLLGDGDHELPIQPLAEIDDAQTDKAVNGRDRPAFDHSSQRLTMLVREPGRLTGRLAIKKPVRAEGVELHHPIANNLHANSADPGCFRPRRTVVDCGQSQKSPRLRPVFQPPGSGPCRLCVEISSQWQGRHGEPPSFAILNQPAADSKSHTESRSPRFGISQRIRKRIEEAFGWVKTVAGQEKTKYRGRERGGWAFAFAVTAYSLTRLRNLMAAPV